MSSHTVQALRFTPLKNVLFPMVSACLEVQGYRMTVASMLSIVFWEIFKKRGRNLSEVMRFSLGYKSYLCICHC